MVQKNVPNLEAQIGKEKQCTMDVNLWRRDGDGIYMFIRFCKWCGYV